MLRKILPFAALLSLSVSLTGCAVYDLQESGYAGSRYSPYGEQVYRYSAVRSAYDYAPPNVIVRRYQQYPVLPEYRYPARQPAVYGYRQASPQYWPAPAWPAYRHEAWRAHGQEREEYPQAQRHARHNRAEQAEQWGRGWQVHGD